MEEIHVEAESEGGTPVYGEEAVPRVGGNPGEGAELPKRASGVRGGPTVLETNMMGNNLGRKLRGASPWMASKVQTRRWCAGGGSAAAASGET